MDVERDGSGKPPVVGAGGSDIRRIFSNQHDVWWLPSRELTEEEEKILVLAIEAGRMAMRKIRVDSVSELTLFVPRDKCQSDPLLPDSLGTEWGISGEKLRDYIQGLIFRKEQELPPAVNE